MALLVAGGEAGAGEGRAERRHGRALRSLRLEMARNSQTARRKKNKKLFFCVSHFSSQLGQQFSSSDGSNH
jgi:hypothetical protein